MQPAFFEELFSKFNNLKVAVIGDVMLDIYWWGNVSRISPEAPVPVVALKNKEVRLGGAANVALNLEALGASVQLYSVIGNGTDGDALLQLLSDNNIGTKGILQSVHRITTTKARILSRSQQMLRLDSEDTHDLLPQEEEIFFEKIQENFRAGKPDIVIFEDYNKGVLTAGLIEKVIALCHLQNIPTCVDPKQKNFFAYRGVTIFKPNWKEVKEGLHLVTDVNEEALHTIHHALQEQLQHKVSLITLSEKGAFFQSEKEGALIPSHIRNIADVSGAGDTVIATAALVWAATANARLMTEIANIAGGLVCEEVGVAAIDKNRLQQECELLLGEIH